MQTIDMASTALRETNSTLQAQKSDTNQKAWEIVNPKGSHAIACGLDGPIEVTVRGSTGYYCAGMNKQAHDSYCRFRRSRRGRKHDVGDRHH